MTPQARMIRRQSDFCTASLTCPQSSRRPNHQMIPTARSSSAANSKYFRYFPNALRNRNGRGKLDELRTTTTRYGVAQQGYNSFLLPCKNAVRKVVMWHAHLA